MTIDAPEEPGLGVRGTQAEGSEVNSPERAAFTQAAGRQIFTWVRFSDLEAAFAGVTTHVRFDGGILHGEAPGTGRSDDQVQIKGFLVASNVVS